MRGPHIEEFEIPPAPLMLAQVNFGWGVICKSSRSVKVNMSLLMKRGPLRINQDSVKFAPHSPIGPTIVATRIINILETKIMAAFTKVRSFICGNRLSIVLVRRREH